MPTPARRARVLVTLPCTFLLLLPACSAEKSAHAGAPALPEGEVRIPADSPKRRYLGIQAVGTSTERIVATVPAQLAADEDHTVRVSSPVTGRIASVAVHPGDVVQAGQVLATIRSSDAAQAGSDATKALAAWTTSKTNLARIHDLFEHQVASAHDLEQARGDEGQARAEYERARARAGQLGVGTAVSDVYALRAPIAGVVLDRSANAGAEVRPDNASPLFTVSSLRSVWMTATIPQRDLSSVHRGTSLRFTTEAAPGRVYAANVSYLSDALDPVTHSATARATLQNDGSLRVQMTGQARVVTSEATPFVVIPTRALVTHGAESVVFVEVSAGRYVRRAVVVRDDDGTNASLTSGLSAGERIVVDGSLLLEAEAERGRGE